MIKQLNNFKIPQSDLITISSMVVVLFLFYPTILLNLNDFMLGVGADAIKNYYTFIYHLKHGDSLTQFTGMHYPYGDHILYGDAQPALLHLFQIIKLVFPGIGEYGVAIINITMFISLIIGAVFIKKILYKLGTPNWFAISSGILLTMMSPQVARMDAHFGLSYTCFIPMIWYYVLQYDSENKFKWLIYSFVTFIFFSLLHLYYLLIGGSFLGLIWLIDTLRSKEKIRQKWHWIRIVMQLIVPILFVFTYLKFGDPVNDRPNNPWGFFEYKSSLKGILLNFDLPITKWINTNWLNIEEAGLEGKSYLGFPSMIFSIIIIIKGTFLLFKNKLRKQFFIKEYPSQNAFFAALILLIFSMGIPFIFGLESLVDHLGLIKQFRSIGRFAWVFYYIFGIISLSAIYSIIKKSYISNKIYIIAFFLISTQIWIYEIGVLHGDKNISFQHNCNHEYWDKVEQDLNELQLEKYQFIVPVPFFHTGSEYIHVSNNSPFELYTSISLRTGLPTPASSFCRTSLSQTIENLKLIYGTKSNPEWNNNESPLLLLFGPSPKLASRDQYFFDSSTTIYENDKFTLKEFSSEHYKLKNEEFEKFNKPNINGNQSVALNSIDINQQSTPNFSIKTKPGENIIFKGKLTDIGKEQLYISLWVKTKFENSDHRTSIIIKRYNDSGEVINENKREFLKNYYDSVDGWIQLKLPAWIWLNDGEDPIVEIIVNQNKNQDPILISKMEFNTQKE